MDIKREEGRIVIMKKKQIIAFMLCGVIAASGLAGCGGKKDGAAAGEFKTAADDKVDENGKVNGVWNKEGLPIVDEGTEFSFSIFCDDNSESKDWYMMDQLEKQTGIDVDVQNYAYEVAKEKFSLALSSGDYADCIGGWCLSESDILKYGVNQKIFVPLESYIEAYCPNTQKVLEIPGVRETVTAPDGHIYAVPYVVDAPMVDFQISVNTKWLENVGMEMPATTEEFEAVLKAFKEKDANGNGDPNDEIPLSFDPDNLKINYLMGWFGMSCDKYGMTVKDGKPVFGANTDQFKEGVKYLNSLYAQGLIDPETFTQDKGMWKSKGAKNTFGATMTYASSDFQPYNAGVTPDWKPLPVLSSPNCSNPEYYRDTTGVSILKNQLVITNKAKDVGAILRFWDTVYDADNSIQIINGPLDDVVFKEDDGYHKIDMSTRSEEDQKKYSWASLFPQSLPKNVPLGFKLIEDPAVYDEKKLDVDPTYEPYLTEDMPAYWMPLDQADEMAEIQTAIEDYIKQKVAEWVAGQADVDADWDAYCKQLDTLGLESYVKMRQDTAEQAKEAAE